MCLLFSSFICKSYTMILRSTVLIPQDGIKANLGMAFQRGSQLVECFNHHFLRMIQSGVMSQINGRAEIINEKFNSIDDAIVLSFPNFVFLYLVLLTGLVLSVSQLAMENVWARIRKRSNIDPATRPTEERRVWK